MADIVDRKTRSRIMSRIGGKHTKPELLVRKALHSRGFRYRIHRRDLPGRPDIVLPRYRAIILVNGCFWHGHDCHLFRWPKTRQDFWKQKIGSNRQRDKRNLDALLAAGWRTCIVWECALKGKREAEVEKVIDEIGGWIVSDTDFQETP